MAKKKNQTREKLQSLIKGLKSEPSSNKKTSKAKMKEASALSAVAPLSPNEQQTNEKAELVSIKTDVNSNIDEQEAKELIKSLIGSSIRLERENKKNKLLNTDFDILVPILEEWLDSFTLLGYSFNGDEVVIGKTQSLKDINSIAILLKKVLDFIVKKYGI